MRTYFALRGHFCQPMRKPTYHLSLSSTVPSQRLREDVRWPRWDHELWCGVHAAAAPLPSAHHSTIKLALNGVHETRSRRRARCRISPCISVLPLLNKSQSSVFVCRPLSFKQKLCWNKALSPRKESFRDSNLPASMPCFWSVEIRNCRSKLCENISDICPHFQKFRANNRNLNRLCIPYTAVLTKVFCIIFVYN